MNVKNDVAFILADRISLYEQQSTFCPNMPLRDLFYICSEYEKLISSETLYSSSLVKIPTPDFVVFYNGTSEQPERTVLKLSDSFTLPTGTPKLELIVTMLNINPDYNPTLLEHCQILKEYTLYISRVRLYAREMPIEKAVCQAVGECINEGILTDFLTKYRSEAIRMSIFEYDEEKTMKIIKQDSFEEGRTLGISQGIAQGIAQGISQGKSQGENLLAELVYRLSADERYSDIKQLNSNLSLREKLFREYALKS